MSEMPPHRPPDLPEPDLDRGDEPGLDERALAQLRALDPDGRHGVLPRVLAAFESSLLRLQAQLATLDASTDTKAVGDLAHTLKSSSASVGALGLARLCADAERAARAGQVERLDGAMAGLRAESARVLGLVRAMLRD